MIRELSAVKGQGTVMKIFFSGVLCVVLMLSMSSGVVGEELDLSDLKAFDWAVKKNGAQVRSRILLAPTADPIELVRLWKKKFGIRLTTEDATHAIVVSVGRVKSHGDLKIKRADIDRMRRLIELELELTNLEARKAPKSEEEKRLEKVKALVEAKPEEFVIGIWHAVY